MAGQLRDLMTRLADEAGPAQHDPTLWRRARRSRQRRGWLAPFAVAAVLTIGVGVVVDPDEPGRPSMPGGVGDSDISSPADPNIPTRPKDSDPMNRLPAGTYDVPLDGPDAPRVKVDLPGGFYWLSPTTFIHAGPTAFGVGFWDGEALKLNTDDCAVEHGTVEFEAPGPTVADLAAALDDSGRRATDPVPVSVGGYDGLYVELTLPPASVCDARPLWVVDPRRGPSLDHMDPGVVDRIWILDVDGDRLVIDAFVSSSDKVNHVAVLTDIIESTTITLPDEP